MIYLLVDPRGHCGDVFYPTEKAAREDCAARNAILGDNWGIVGVYWRVRAISKATAAQVGKVQHA